MKSPFPGMDPYIEEVRLFEDFHDALISEIKRALAKILPERYVVRTSERPYVVIAETEGKEEHRFNPDVGVLSRTPAGSSIAGAVAVADLPSATQKVSMRAFIATDYREKFIEIYALQPERTLVTCVEILSPSNKRRGTTGWETYMRKRQGLLLGEANLVEMDLLRHGNRFPMLDPWPTSPYTVLVCRRDRAPYCDVWPAHFLSRMPVIPVPLLSEDADVNIDLQPMFDTIYADFQYARDIDYTRPLTPPLTAEESTWLAQQLQQRA
jgi:hypothetical protein